MSVRSEPFAEECLLITIDRPERRNALDSTTASQLAEAVAYAGNAARVVILSGAGEAFCSGGDLEELERWSDLTEDQIGTALYDSYQAMIRSIRASDAVVIAAINGAAVGAGLDLALACDLRVAATTAKLGQVWVRLGVIPGTGGAWLTQALIGPTKAAELLLTGRVIGAAEAHQLGLVNDVVEPDSLLARCRDLAEEILANPREGVIANKRAFVAAREPALDAALAYAAKVQPQRFRSEEFRAALRSRKSPAR